MLKAILIITSICALLLQATAQATESPREVLWRERCAEQRAKGAEPPYPSCLPRGLADELTPPVPPWPDGLPRPQQTPDGSIIVPPELAKAQFERDLFLVRYPGLCHAALEQEAFVLGFACKGQLATQAAQANEASDQRNASAEAHRFTLSKAFISGAVGAAIGAVITIWAESKRKN